MYSWKDAASKQETSRMRETLDTLHVHVTEYLESLGVDRVALEMEGLGLRPLVSIEHLTNSQRQALSRRFYRVAQWSEILQGAFWLTVSRPV